MHHDTGFMQHIAPAPTPGTPIPTAITHLLRSLAQGFGLSWESKALLMPRCSRKHCRMPAPFAHQVLRAQRGRLIENMGDRIELLMSPGRRRQQPIEKETQIVHRCHTWVWFWIPPADICKGRQLRSWLSGSARSGPRR